MTSAHMTLNIIRDITKKAKNNKSDNTKMM